MRSLIQQSRYRIIFLLLPVIFCFSTESKAADSASGNPKATVSASNKPKAKGKTKSKPADFTPLTSGSGKIIPGNPTVTLTGAERQDGHEWPANDQVTANEKHATPYVNRGTGVTISSPIDSIKVDINQNRLTSDDWAPAKVPGTFSSAKGTLEGKFGDIQFDGGIPHNSIARISVYDHLSQEPNKPSRYYFDYSHHWSWSGLTFPLLMRIVPSGNQFQLQNVAPTIASGIKYHFDNNTFKYLSLNAFATFYPVTGSTSNAATSSGSNNQGLGLKTDTPYTLAFGTILDINGLIQAGYMYHIVDQKYYAVIGFRPDALFNKIFSLNTK